MRRRAKSKTVSSPSGRRRAKGSPKTRNRPVNGRRSDVAKATGEVGTARSRPPRRMKRLPDASAAGTSASPRPRDRASSRVSGALSRKPCGPHSTVWPASISVRILPPARSDASKTATSSIPWSRDSHSAAASPVMPAPMIAMRVWVSVKSVILPWLRETSIPQGDLWTISANRGPFPAH